MGSSDEQDGVGSWTSDSAFDVGTIFSKFSKFHGSKSISSVVRLGFHFQAFKASMGGNDDQFGVTGWRVGPGDNAFDVSTIFSKASEFHGGKGISSIVRLGFHFQEFKSRVGGLDAQFGVASWTSNSAFEVGTVCSEFSKFHSSKGCSSVV